MSQLKEYHTLLANVLANGVKQKDRTGVGTRMLPGAMCKYAMADGFPAITTKKLAFNQVKGELIGFLQGSDNAADFRALGCNIWDQNANENEEWVMSSYRKGLDDLGRIYGVQWRDWRAYGFSVDQVEKAIQTIRTNPYSRRIIISGWNPAELHEMALPPCHVLYQFIVEQETKKLHLCMYQRSCDMFLGVPFNIASASLLLHIIAYMTGYTAGTFTHMMADVHIYENHIEQVRELLNRQEYPSPQLRLDFTALEEYHFKMDGVKEALMMLKPTWFSLENYVSHEAIKAPMAV